MKHSALLLLLSLESRTLTCCCRFSSPSQPACELLGACPPGHGGKTLPLGQPPSSLHLLTLQTQNFCVDFKEKILCAISATEGRNSRMTKWRLCYYWENTHPGKILKVCPQPLGLPLGFSVPSSCPENLFPSFTLRYKWMTYETYCFMAFCVPSREKHLLSQKDTFHGTFRIISPILRISPWH